VPTHAADSSPAPAGAQRLVSIDALRGFDMFWIIGGDRLAQLVLTRVDWKHSVALSKQLEHVEWEGFRFYDLIFPLFLFLVGCVIPYSLAKFRDRPAAAYGRIVRRTLLLLVLGFVCNGVLQFQFEEMRWAGVLQRIGLCYGIAALISLHTTPRGQALLVAVVLAAYWAILTFIPAPGGTAGDLSPEGNLAGYIDRNWLPGDIKEEYYGHGDNEGWLSTLPAIATTLLGVLAGEWLRSSVGPWKKTAGLIVAGAACLAGGYSWGETFPIIKILWTSSFVLVAGGWSLLLLALFYLVIDVLGWRWWAFFFVVIGLNAITIFVAPRFIDFNKMATFFLGGVISRTDVWGPVIAVAGALACKWIFLWVLYRQKLFLRV
jgi:predicted acyltransferase